MQIERVEIRAVGPEVVRHTWSEDLPGQYMTNTLVRLTTDDGVTGASGIWNATSFDYDRYTAESLRHLAPVLLGRDPLEREQLMHDLRPRVWPLPAGALAAIEIALWDIAGRVAGQPVHALLGTARDRIPAYASTPLLEDVPAYLECVENLIGQGFRAVKLHTWCVPERDVALARAVRRANPGDAIAFMLDAENNYARDDALAVGRVLGELGFAWFEAPLPDHDLEGYRELTRRLSVPVLPSGNWIQDLDFFEECLRTGVWSAARTDVTMLGGIAPAHRAMSSAAAAGLRCELFSWGYTLVSAANLHVMLAGESCTYFEQPVPYPDFDFGMRDVIRPSREGYVEAPRSPGIGFEIDWEAMERATVHRLDFRRR